MTLRSRLAFKHLQCGIHPDGVHDLDCFGKKSSPGKKTCVWKPGNHGKTHTLIIQQHTPTTRNKVCKVHINITDMSQEIRIWDKYNMTVQVFENSKSTNCTKAVFRGSPNSLFRCGPPYNASFSRHAGRLVVNVSWQQEDRKVVEYYSVRYKALDNLSWSELPMQCQIGKEYTVENLDSSLVYNVQIQCVTSDKCTQCPWSEVYTVPPELTTQPVIVRLEDTDIAERKGTRLLSITWKFPAKQLHEGFYVTIGKASGEPPRERMNTSHPEIRLILSHSAYHLNISAFNSASTSPALRQIIPQRDDELTMEAGKVDVTVHSNTSITIYWKDDLIKKYVCYSAEWMTKGHEAQCKSFYENKHNHRTLSPLPEPLEPYKRYSLTLHRRPNKDTCNMKHINNSESTYGRTQFYFIEGSPVSAPTNISCYNATLNSLVLQWSSIPEEDIRGFLLGYVIYYSEYHHRGIERNVTVDPLENSYELTGLRSDTAYEIQIAGFTRAGEGERSQAILFKTKYHGYSNMNSIIIVSAVVAFVLIFGTPLIKRGKAILWPSIPNPGKSNAMQKIERPCEVELLKSINTLKAEEWDTNSLQIVAKEDVNPASTLPSMLPLLRASVDEDDSAQMTCNWIQRDNEDSSGDILPDINAETILDIHRTDQQTSAFPSGYTTMEMFQQGVPQPANTSVTEESKPAGTDFTVMKAGQDYIRHIIASPMLDIEGTSTIL
ncbi:protein sidekick-2 isoform X3 [Larimichthys crocea]|uniref:protein sidekick-2 isoform X3 n=1 Tax=Larimichthys crocea TaxID=215358 RepID=UPI000F5F07E3|nr:protein sidekick-2 isoform X3 [Larimichthys crocea]